MDSFASLLLLCVAMFIGSMAAGVVPVYCALSPSRVRVLTVFGAGLLVGTALIVIIPEGVHMWYEAEAQAKAVVQAAVTVAGSSVQQGAVSLAVAATAAAVVAPSPSKLAERGTVLAQVPPPATGFLRGAANTGLAAPKVGVVGHADAHASHDHTHADGEHDHDHSHEEGGGHRMIGASLASGFAFMLIVDTIGGGHGHGHGSHGHGSHSHSHGGGSGGSGSSLGEDAKSDSGASVLPHAHGSHNKKEDDAVVDDAGGGGGGGGSSSDAQHRTRNAAMGLLVHAAVDGIALGAAAASNQGSVELLVFVAIMLHKAPAAFGLSSYLVHSGASHEDGAHACVVWVFGGAL